MATTGSNTTEPRALELLNENPIQSRNDDDIKLDSKVVATNSPKFVFYHPHEKLERDHDSLTDKSIPHKFDILCGRDKVCHNHIGNHRFRIIIEMYRVAYQTAPSKEEKMRITKEIVTTVTSNGFRFLKKVGTGNSEEWTELDEAMARDKVSHALRGAKDPHQQQQRRKQQSNHRRSGKDTPTPVGSPLLSAAGGVVNSNTRRRITMSSAARRKRSTSEDSASSTSTSGSEFTSSGASNGSHGAAKASKHLQGPQSQPPEPPPVQVKVPSNEFMSMESIGQSLQRQASLQLDDNPLASDSLSPPQLKSDTKLSRHQRFLEISRRQEDVLREPPTESHRRFLFGYATQRAHQGDEVQSAPLTKGSTPSATLQAQAAAPPAKPQIPEKLASMTPISVISDEDEDEPPTISELMKDKLLCEALLDSLRHQKIDNHTPRDGDDGAHAASQMFESMRSVDTIMSSASQQHMDSIRSVDMIMSLVSKVSSPRPNGSNEDVPQIRLESTQFLDMSMSRLSKPSPRLSDTEPLPLSTHYGGAFRDDAADNEDEDEPPTIADLMNDKMLCEALLGSLRLEPFKSQDDIMSTFEKTSP